MDPSGNGHNSTDHPSPANTNMAPMWYRKQTFDFYHYESDDEGFVQSIYRNPDLSDDHGGQRQGRGILKQAGNSVSSSYTSSFAPRASSPAIKRGSTPVTFDFPSGPAPKHSHNAKPQYQNQEYGPTTLRSHYYSAQSSVGYDYWYYHQSFGELDAPLPVQKPRHEGTIFLHRDLMDNQYQLWMWVESTGVPSWQPVDLDGDIVIHPKDPQRGLKMTQGEPRWVLLSTLARSRSKSRGPSIRRSTTPNTTAKTVKTGSGSE